MKRNRVKKKNSKKRKVIQNEKPFSRHGKRQKKNMEHESMFQKKKGSTKEETD